ncbi:uncharacterized protein [Triticum aestivum]|uniref:uncharacterized protein n=1 Tax=Triticum aestivum TaxID=4565 RepID=UPI001D0350F2|nr:uncharacterized protein LOC123115593 [Triticum aestivum]
MPPSPWLPRRRGSGDDAPSRGWTGKGSDQRHIFSSPWQQCRQATRRLAMNIEDKTEKRDYMFLQDAVVLLTETILSQVDADQSGRNYQAHDQRAVAEATSPLDYMTVLVLRM